MPRPGEVTIGRETLARRRHGQRDHSWGVRDWWAFGWCWGAARLDDGTRVHLADIRIPGQPVAFGYVQPPGAPVESVTSLGGDRGARRRGCRRPTRPDKAGPSGPAIEPLAFGPFMLTAPDGRISRFARAVARFTAGDGRSGPGGSSGTSPRPPGTPTSVVGCASPRPLRADPSHFAFVDRIRTRFAETDALGSSTTVRMRATSRRRAPRCCATGATPTNGCGPRASTSPCSRSTYGTGGHSDPMKW